MIILKELHLKNFRSWKELDLVDMDKFGLCLIQGENGSGKSSLRHALEYLFTDTTTDDLSLEELPFNGNTECRISCKLLRDKDEIEIIKYRNHKKQKNNTILLINGDDKLTKTDRRETQKEIDKLLGIGNLTLTTILSHNSPSFAGTKESERKQILYELLDLYRYDDYLSNAKTKCTNIETLLHDNEIQINNSKNRIEELINDLKNAKESKNSFDEEKRKKIASLLVERDEQKSIDTTGIEKEIKILKEGIINIDEDLWKEKLDKISELDKEHFSTEAEIRTIKLRMSEIGSSTCPVLKEECERLSEEKDRIINENEPLLSKLQKKSTRLEVQKNELTSIRDNIKDSKSNNEKTELQIRSLQDKINNEKESERRRVENIDKLIKDITERENPYIKMEEDTQKKLLDAELNIKELKEANKEATEEYKYYEFWVKGYGKGGLPNLKIERVLDTLEMETNRYLSKISNARVELTSQDTLKSKEVREKIGYKIYESDKSISDYSSYSAGERQKIKTADVLGFSAVAANFNFLFMDEVLDVSLSANSCLLLMDLLKLKVEEGFSVFVVSHSSELKERFDEVLTIEKRDGVSYIK